MRIESVMRRRFPRPWLAGEGMSGGGGSSATWSPTTKNAHVTLSNGNLTAKSDGTNLNLSGLGSAGITAGQKRYFEITVNVASVDGGIGLVKATFSLVDGRWLGIDSDAIGYYPDGVVYFNSVARASGLQTFINADVIGIAVHGGTAAWFRINAGNWNNNPAGNPTTGANGIDISDLGTVFPGYTVRNSPPDVQFTANFGATAFARTPPAGFTAIP